MFENWQPWWDVVILVTFVIVMAGVYLATKRSK